MQMKQVLAVAAIAAVAGVLVAGKSDAGTKTPEPVVIDAAHKAFWGNMGTARASADNLQHIGCQITASSSGIVANSTVVSAETWSAGVFVGAEVARLSQRRPVR